jgi:diadenosine tetraphosphate (Ap4A) HIT family hydrolase
MDKMLTHLSSNCCLCAEIASGKFPSEYQSCYGVNSRICQESTEFVVIPTLSPLCAGHVLILPRLHVTNLASLAEPLRWSLLACLRSTVNQLSQHFGESFYFFEHGVDGSGVACGIDHAHMHILPLSANIVGTIESRVEMDFPACDIGSLSLVLSAASQNKGQSYLLRGADLESIRLSVNHRIPSQYMRQLIAAVGLKSDWDWKLLTGRTEFIATCMAFGQAQVFKDCAVR